MLRHVLIGSAIGALTAAAACASFSADPGPGMSAPDADVEANAPDGGSAWAPCATRPKHDQAHFCDDFDDTSVGITTQWSGTLLTDGGSLDATAQALTPPRAMVSFISAGNTGTEAALHEIFDQVGVAAASRILVDFEVRIVTPPTVLDGGSNYSHLTVLDFGPPECVTLNGGLRQRAIELSFKTAKGFGGDLKGLQGCPDGGPEDYVSFDTLLTPASFMDRFHRVRLEVNRTSCPVTDGGTTPFSATVTIDEERVACVGIRIDPFAAAKPLNLHLGVYTGPGPEHSEQLNIYDNVQVTIE